MSTQEKSEKHLSDQLANLRVDVMITSFGSPKYVQHALSRSMRIILGREVNES